MGWINLEKEGPGFDRSKYPSNRFGLFFMLLMEYFGKIVLLNLIFLLFCLPIVTIPAAICAMHAVMIKIVMDRPVFLWHDFFTAFKRDFKTALGMGLIYAGLFAAAIVGYYYYWNLCQTSLIAILPFALVLICLIILWFMACYSFVMLPLVALPIKQIIKNSLIFALAGIPQNLIILGCLVGVLWCSLGLWPMGLLVPVLIGCSLICFVSCFLCLGRIKKFVILPYYEKNSIELPKEFKNDVLFG